MDIVNKKNVLIVIAVIFLITVATVGGIFGAKYAHELLTPTQNEGIQSSNKENESKISSNDDENLYKEIIKDLDEKDYDSAYKKLLILKENKPTSDKIKNLDEIYYYTKAKLYIKDNNMLSAKEIISKIKDDYTGLFSKEILEIKKGFTNNVTLERNNNSSKVADSQKILLTQKENIRVRMNNQIANIRDKQTREDIAYKEGFLSIKQYFTNKAQNEVDIQRIKLNAANEEIEAIKNTSFSSAEEKEIEQDTAMAKKNRIEQELQHAYKAKEEVANVNASFDRAMEQWRQKAQLRSAD
ncbi:MAG: hypothetical protein E7202_03560 [Selenomonas ruminantium]|jgi:hypothetical protein|nr:hypothetical protein [Selenomonas ruminantium]